MAMMNHEFLFLKRITGNPCFVILSEAKNLLFRKGKKADSSACGLRMTILENPQKFDYRRGFGPYCVAVCDKCGATGG
jgi:hypothetical protein